MQFVTNETGQNKVMTGTTTHPLVNIFIDAAVVSGFIWFLQCVENMATTLTAGDTYTQPRLLLDLEHVTSIGLKDVHLMLCEWSQQLLGIEPRFPGLSCHPGVNIEGCENWWLSGGHSLQEPWRWQQHWPHLCTPRAIAPQCKTEISTTGVVRHKRRWLSSGLIYPITSFWVFTGSSPELDIHRITLRLYTTCIFQLTTVWG